MQGKEKCSENNGWISQLENAVLSVNYAKTSIRDVLAVKPRTSRNIHASSSSAPKKKMSDIVKSAWNFHAILCEVFPNHIVPYSLQ